MFSFVKGTYFLAGLLVTMAIIIIGSIRRAKNTSWMPKIRRIAGLDAIEEAVGRATEMGRPVHFAPGISDITTDTAPQTFAGLEVLGYLTHLSAKYNTEVITTIRIPNVFPLAQEVMRQAYMEAGKPDMFTDQSVRYLSDQNLAYVSGVMGIMAREKVAASILMGAFWAESMLLAETGARLGAIQVAGTANMHQIPFFVAACDYTIIGEELFAAGAYLAQDKVKLGAIVGQDYIKGIALVLLVLGSLLATAKIDALRTLIRM